MLAENRVTANAAGRARELAETMRRFGPDGCTRGALLAAGFSNREIDTLGPTARRLATSRFVRFTDGDADADTIDSAALTRHGDDELIAIAGDRCAGLVTPEAIVIRLRAVGFTIDTIDRLWDRLMPRLAAQLSTELVRLPRPARLEA